MVGQERSRECPKAGLLLGVEREVEEKRSVKEEKMRESWKGTHLCVEGPDGLQSWWIGPPSGAYRVRMKVRPIYEW
jgi:hypothetical protein